jgi:hypothetical protein
MPTGFTRRPILRVESSAVELRMRSLTTITSPRCFGVQWRAGVAIRTAISTGGGDERASLSARTHQHLPK